MFPERVCGGVVVGIDQVVFLRAVSGMLGQYRVLAYLLELGGRHLQLQFGFHGSPCNGWQSEAAGFWPTRQ